MQDAKVKPLSAPDEPEFRIINRLELATGPTGDGDARGPYVGVAVDVETTGLSPEDGAIIELALRRFRYDAAGIITDIDEPYAWLEDPHRPIPDEITSLTGLAVEDLEGQAIDEAEATTLLRSASFVVAHHAGFDRRWIEDRLEGARGLNWACSLEQIDWRSHGFEGKALGFLLAQSGYFHAGHRAGADVDALIQLLRNRFDDGRTALKEMVERAARTSWIVRADGANIALKDMLRMRGYRWDVARNVWWREVADEDRIAEEFWLAGHVYDMAAKPKAIGPSFERIRANTRFL